MHIHKSLVAITQSPLMNGRLPSYIIHGVVHPNRRNTIHKHKLHFSHTTRVKTIHPNTKLRKT